MANQINRLESLYTTDQFEKALRALEQEISIAEEKYEDAERSYSAVGEWLNRVNSSVFDLNPQVYVQGSFRLGTAINPWTDSGEYDVDAVCELRAANQYEYTQKQIKELVGAELKYYAVAKNMSKKVKEGKRCWTLEYADGSQFHLDVLPSVPHISRSNSLRAPAQAQPNAPSFDGTAIAITDRKHHNYSQYSFEWPRSNPKGYADWFRSRTETQMRAEKQVLAKRFRESVEEIPDFRVRTPLQASVKLLKRHRDMMFAGRPEDAPISIVISTLAGWAYQGESSVGEALVQIVFNMERYIDWDGHVPVVRNPVDDAENFTDKWYQEPEKAEAFREWLSRVQQDVQEMADGNDQNIYEVAACSFGQRTANRAFGSSSSTALVEAKEAASKVAARGTFVARASHRRKAPWRQLITGDVWFDDVIWNKNGFRTLHVYSDGEPVSPNGNIKFVCETDVPHPFDVYWQVVNSGGAAEGAGGLRGSIERGRSNLTRTESTLYPGTHAIECFIVKDGYMAARSGQFLVNMSNR